VLLLDHFDRLLLTGMLLKYCLTVINFTFSLHTHDLMHIYLHCKTITPEQKYVSNMRTLVIFLILFDSFFLY